MRTPTARTSQVAGQEARDRAVSRIADAERAQRSRDSWQGEEAAIYCRVSHIKDQDQTSVDRQERIARETAENLGLIVAHVLIDPNRSAWKRDRKRPGWDELLKVAKRDGVRHIVVYHPDRLMRQPYDLEELLNISEQFGIILHGKSGHRDLNDPDDRHYLRGEIAHACRSSDDTSRRLKDAMVDRARDGKPHTGSRRYGYSADAMTIVDSEAGIVRWIFDSFLDGMTPNAITADLNRRGILTAQGKKRWQNSQVLKLLGSHHVAGIRIFRGAEIGPGTWPAIIDTAVFREAQERRAYRSAVNRERYAVKSFYLLRGLVWCVKCGQRMQGRGANSRRVYGCDVRHLMQGEEKCYRVIGAVTLEAFMKDAAIDLLERLDVTGQQASAILSVGDHAAMDAHRAEIAELKDMWDNQEIRTAEYRQMRKVVEDRISEIQARTIIRPAAEVLEGMTGPGARATWEGLENAGSWERLNAVLRFLFAAIRIGDSHAPNGLFDYGRIEIEQNQI